MRDWLKVFPRDQMLVMRTEDYSSDMGSHLHNVFKFLNIGKSLIISDLFPRNCRAVKHVLVFTSVEQLSVFEGQETVITNVHFNWLLIGYVRQDSL